MEIRTYEPSNHKVRMMIYGGSGIGKTVFGSTAPKPLFLAVEEGLLSLSGKDMPFVRIKSLQDMRDVLAALKANKLTDAKGQPIQYETIIIDSLTEMQQVVIKNITGGRMPSMKQWGDFSDQMAEILKGFASLDTHIIFTCLESEKNDEDDDGREFSRYQPELFGKLAEKAMAMMDFVGRYYMKVEVINDKPTHKRVLTFTISPRWRAKDRSGKMPQFADPNFTTLMSEFAKIKIGDGVAVGNLESGMAAPTLKFAPDPKDTPATKEQWADINEAWKQLMAVCTDKTGKEIPQTKWDAYLGATMKQHCGVDTTTKLKKKQANDFFGHILDEIKKWPAKDITAPTVETPAKEKPKAEEKPYDVMADLARREELDELSRAAVDETAEALGIKITPKMKKGEVIDAIMAVEMPNAPKEKPKA